MPRRQIICAVLALVLWTVFSKDALACVITLHAPNGTRIKVHSEALAHGMIRPITPDQHDHLVANTNTVILIAGRYQGVRETAEEIELLERCEKPPPAAGPPRRLGPPEYPAAPGPRG